MAISLNLGYFNRKASIFLHRRIDSTFTMCYNLVTLKLER